MAVAFLAPALLARRGGASTRRPRACVLLASALQYTPLEGNSFRLAFPGGFAVLADPWLVGPLGFGPPQTAFIYAGKKRVCTVAPTDEPALQIAVAGLVKGVDLILLSQGLPDHAHVPTLERLPKSMPVVASPTAASVARSLGFRNVTALAHGEKMMIAGPSGGNVSITATPGALVGPPWATRENGFIIRDDASALSVYYEPHDDYDAAAVQKAVSASPIDLAITPVVSVGLAGYPLVFGEQRVVDLLKLLSPSAVMPLLNACIIEEGLLAGLVTRQGGVDDVRRRVQNAGLRSRILEPGPPGQAMTIDFE